MIRCILVLLLALLSAPLAAQAPENPGCILGKVSPKAHAWLAEMTANPREPETPAQKALMDEVLSAGAQCMAFNAWNKKDVENAIIYASATAWNTRSLRRLAATGYDATTLADAAKNPGFAAFYTHVEAMNAMDEGRPAADNLLASLDIDPLSDDQRRHAQDVLLSAAFVQFATQEFFGQAP